MIALFRFGIILSAYISGVYLENLCSSYFTFSHWPQKQSLKDTIKTAEFTSATSIACALRCNTRSHCDKATFDRDTKRCSLYQNKGKDSTDIHASDVDPKLKIVTLRKVRHLVNRYLFCAAISFSSLENAKNAHSVLINVECRRRSL